MIHANTLDVLPPQAEQANKLLQVAAIVVPAGTEVVLASGEVVPVPEISEPALSALHCFALGMTREETARYHLASEDFLHTHFKLRRITEAFGIPGAKRPALIYACYRLGLLTCNTDLPDDVLAERRLSPREHLALEYGALGRTATEFAAAENIPLGTANGHRSHMLERLGAANMSMAVTIGWATRQLAHNMCWNGRATLPGR